MDVQSCTAAAVSESYIAAVVLGRVKSQQSSLFYGVSAEQPLLWCSLMYRRRGHTEG